MATLRNMKTLLKDTNYNDRLQRAIADSTDANWQVWYGIYPVPQQVKELMEKLTSAMPNIQVHPSNLLRHEHEGKTAYLVNEFSIYMDEYPFDFGRIGYRDYTTGKKNDENIYGIYSRKIHNAKYGTGRDQFHMVMTASVDKAVKMGMKYLVPYTHSELARAHYKSIVGNASQSNTDALGELAKTINPISGARSELLIQELLHLIHQKATFKSAEFNEVLANLEGAYNRMKEEQARVVDAQFVRFRKVGGDMYVDVMTAQDVRRNDFKASLGDIMTYKMDELPEDLLGSISVLNILEDGQYVTRVGQKVDDTTFWIERG
jgi:hypothetical protein